MSGSSVDFDGNIIDMGLTTLGTTLGGTLGDGLLGAPAACVHGGTSTDGATAGAGFSMALDEVIILDADFDNGAVTDCGRGR